MIRARLIASALIAASVLCQGVPAIGAEDAKKEKGGGPWNSLQGMKGNRTGAKSWTSLQETRSFTGSPLKTDRWVLKLAEAGAHDSMRLIPQFQDPEQLSKEQIQGWNKWSRKVLHLVYRDLEILVQPVSREIEVPFEIAVHKNGFVTTKLLKNTGILPSITYVGNAMSGDKEVAFPMKIKEDIVYIRCSLGYGSPPKGEAPQWHW